MREGEGNSEFRVKANQEDGLLRLRLAMTVKVLSITCGEGCCKDVGDGLARNGGALRGCVVLSVFFGKWGCWFVLCAPLEGVAEKTAAACLRGLGRTPPS